MKSIIYQMGQSARRIVRKIAIITCVGCSDDLPSGTPATCVGGTCAYLADFEAEWGNFAMDLNVTLEDQIDIPSAAGGTTIGVCDLGWPKRVMLLRGWWYVMSDDAHRVLMYHELGHCLLNRPHDTDINPDGAPASIMYPIIDGVVENWPEQKRRYVDELFGHPRDLPDPWAVGSGVLHQLDDHDRCTGSLQLPTKTN